MGDKKTLSSIQKVWSSGTTLVVALPRRIREILEINKGDYIEVDWGEVIKRSNKKEEKKKIIKKEETEEELPDFD